MKIKVFFLPTKCEIIGKRNTHGSDPNVEMDAEKKKKN